MVAVAGAQAPADSSGLAGTSVFNPQETNVPYLAWRGEEVRLVKCIGGLDSTVGLGGPTLTTNDGFIYDRNGFELSMSIFNYSGPQENSFDGPKAVTNSASVFESDGRICARGTWISNKAGIVTVKLTLSHNGVILGQHDFLIGWMAINSPAITNSGSVTENPAVLPGNSVNVQVSGTIPLNTEFQQDWGLPATLVMPRDWALWAHAMATTDQYLGGTNALDPSAYWDIHDSSGPLGNESPNGSPDVHISQVSCPDSTPDPFIDQVDNCTGGEDWYSRIFGDLTTGETGPFDPSYSSTLLSDGRLNSNDAPMPALKIVLNSSGGMGGFENSCLNDKDNAYSRNFDPTNIVNSGEEAPGDQYDCVAPNTSEDSAHALYAPYYSQYVPATSRDPFGAASGVDGPIYSNMTGQPNNFAGFGWYGEYQNWEIAQNLVQNQSQDTNCLLTTRNYEPVYRQTNGFATRIVVFTDEHGEARAQWQPGVNNDNFGTTVGFVDENGGCDLEGVNLGAQTITASARYPYQPIGLDVAATGSITKNINNLFQKSVTCHRKNNVSSAIAYICVASAQDIAGNGDVFNGEKVCFSREPDNVWYNVGGSNSHPNGYCVYLDGGTATAPATAQVETPATLVGSSIDVQAYFAGEKLLRDTCIISGQPNSLPGPCGGGGVGNTTTGNTTTGNTTTGNTTTGGSTGTTGITSINHVVPKGKAAASVQSVQLVLTKTGRVLMVKIHSINKTAKIQIRLINAKGKVITVAVRTVNTNKRVKVAGLRIGKNVKSVKVRIVS